MKVINQEQLNAVPKDYKDTIYIEFGTILNPAIVGGNLYVEAWENSHVEAWENSHVVAMENSHVVARENSHVVAMENSHVEAWENSHVEANGNVQITDITKSHNISINGNARIVYNPKTIIEYCDFYNIEYNDITTKLYKAVHKIEEKYFSDKDSKFEYIIGEYAIPDSFNSDVNKEYSNGIHVSHLNYAIDFGKNFNDLAILEVEAELQDTILPINSDKLRCKKVKVLREVPLEECGIYGKILLNRMNNNS